MMPYHTLNKPLSTQGCRRTKWLGWFCLCQDYVDDQTIGVVCIMGNHYGGQRLGEIKIQEGNWIKTATSKTCCGFQRQTQKGQAENPKWEPEE